MKRLAEILKNQCPGTISTQSPYIEITFENVWQKFSKVCALVPGCSTLTTQSPYIEITLENLFSSEVPLTTESARHMEIKKRKNTCDRAPYGNKNKKCLVEGGSQLL